MNAPPAASSIRVEREFAHSPERVFAAFSTARAVAAWMSPAPQIAPAVRQWDFQREGRYRIEYGLPDDQTLALFGTFLRIEPPAALSMTWQWQEPDPHAGILSHVAIAISPFAGGSRLLIEHSRLDGEGMPDRHNAGWLGALHRLDDFLLQSEGDI